MSGYIFYLQLIFFFQHLLFPHFSFTRGQFWPSGIVIASLRPSIRPRPSVRHRVRPVSGNIPHGAAYGVYTTQVIRYARVCNEADDFKENKEE